MVLAFTIPDACKASGLGRTSLYYLIKSGHLRSRKHGSRTLILASDLRAFLEGLPEGSPEHRSPHAPPLSTRRRSVGTPARKGA